MSMRNGNGNGVIPPVPKRPVSKESEDVAGPRFNQQEACPEGQREAGDPIIYSDTEVRVPLCLCLGPETNRAMSTGIPLLA